MNLAPAGALLLAAVIYARGARSHEQPAWRAALFFLGLAAGLFSLAGPLDQLAATFFSGHMVQHMLLTTVAAPLIWLGQPLMPMWLGLPAVMRAVLRPLGSPRLAFAVTLLRHPLVAAAAYISGLYLWHVPSVYDAAAADLQLHILQHWYFLFGGLWFWSAVIDPAPFQARLAYPVRIPFLLLCGAAQNTILGGLLTFSSRPLYSFYRGKAEAVGMDGLADQQLGGALMWVGGDLIFLAAASLCFFLFLAKEERDQEARERGVVVKG